ncbi:MAG: hypothetical protein U1E36_03230 [Rickettsiales bacterium]
MKHLLFIFALSLLVPISAEATCFKNSIPGPCSENDRSVQAALTPLESIMYSGRDQYTGNPWHMVERQSGDRTVYTGNANGKSWTIIKHAVGSQINYSGITAEGRRFSYTCSPDRCANYINATSIKTRPAPPPEPIKSANKYTVITIDPTQYINVGVLLN